MSLDVDEMLEHVGGIGLYQIRLVLMIGYLMASSSWLTLIVGITTAEPSWRCVNDSTLCNVTGWMKAGHEHYKLRCNLPTSEWEFEDKFTSIVTEWNLICDDSVLTSVASSMVFAGWLVGCLLGGWIADRYGRKPVLFAAVTTSSLAGLISAFSQSLWLYVVCRFIIGLGVGGSITPEYTLSGEITGVKYRGSVATSNFVFWYVAFCLIPLFAWLIPSWRTLTIVLSVPALPCVLLWKWVPESPRWLLIEGRNEDARKVLQKVARVNGKTMPEDELCLSVSKSEDSQNGNILDLFRTWTVARLSLIMFTIWFSVSLQSYGTTFFSVTMAGNMYVNFFLAAVMGIPANIYAIWVMNWCGRRKSLLVGLLIPVTFSIVMIFIPPDTDNVGINAVRMILFMAIKFFNYSAFSLSYVLSAEVFPTMTRNVGMGACSAMARIGAFSAPFIVWLQRIHLALPMSIMSVCTMLAALLTLTIRETHMQPTVETVVELRQVVEGKPRTNKVDNNDELIYKNEMISEP